MRSHGRRRPRPPRRGRHRPRQLPWTQLRWAEGLVFFKRGQADRALDTLNGTPWRLLALGDLRGGSLAANDLIDLHLGEEIRDDAVAVARRLLAELRSLGAGPGLVTAVRRCGELLAASGDVTGMTRAPGRRSLHLAGEDELGRRIRASTRLPPPPSEGTAAPSIGEAASPTCYDRPGAAARRLPAAPPTARPEQSAGLRSRTAPSMHARAPGLLGIVLLILLGLGPPAAAGPSAGESPWLTHVDQALAAAAGGRLVLVDLYAEWCGWCKQLEREVFTDPEFVAWARDFVLLRVDVEDGGEGSELQARFAATSLPTTLILDHRRVKVGEVAGFHPTGRFIAALEAEIAAYRGLLELFDKVRRSGDAELQERLAADFHQRGDGLRAAALYEQALERVPGDGAAWLHYQAADALRLGGELGAAEPHLERSLALARQLGDPALLERLGLLAFYLAEDRGDCAEAVAALERFLAEHPASAYRGLARRTLKAIQKGEEMECT